MPDTKPEHPDKARYDYVANQINREDGLVNYRLTWTLQANGFLFAALALVGKDLTGTLKLLFTYAVPFTGLIVSAAGLAGVYAANGQIRYLVRLLEQRPYPEEWPRPYGGKRHFFLGTFPSYGPLLVLTAVWSAAFIAPFVMVQEKAPTVPFVGTEKVLWFSGTPPSELTACQLLAAPAQGTAPAPAFAVTCSALAGSRK